jgi:hypothetical protein
VDRRVIAVLFYPNDSKKYYSLDFSILDIPFRKDCVRIESKSIEEAEWQATLEIYNTCNILANQCHKLRDHLPSIHKLFGEISNE